MVFDTDVANVAVIHDEVFVDVVYVVQVNDKSAMAAEEPRRGEQRF